MKCPACDDNLVMAERQGIEIDYCPGCRGVWLDRGELDKIIERSGSTVKSRRDDDSDEYDRERLMGRFGGYPKKKKKSSILGEIFDF